jgi:hypothetical protein
MNHLELCDLIKIKIIAYTGLNAQGYLLARFEILVKDEEYPPHLAPCHCA